MSASGGTILRRWPRAVAIYLLALLLAGCAPGQPSYMPVAAGIDPYARLRERAEEYYQAGLAQERAADWRGAVRNYEQAVLWDPDNRAVIRASRDRAREMVASANPAMATATPTLRPVPRAGASNSPVPNPTNIPAPIPTPARPAMPSPTIVKAGYRMFRSKGLPYSIAYPIDWVAREDVIADKEKRVDLFAGQVASRGAASVLVTGIVLTQTASVEQFHLQVVEGLQREADFRELTPRTVAGTRAYLVTYSTVDNGKIYMATHAIFISGGMGWLVTLLATPDAAGNARGIFEVMLSSFQPAGEVY